VTSKSASSSRKRDSRVSDPVRDEAPSVSDLHPEPTASVAALSSTSDLEARLRELETALQNARSEDAAAGRLQHAYRTAHRVVVSADTAALTEVASAVIYIEDVLEEMLDGEMAREPSAWRQVDAALRSAWGALALAEPPALRGRQLPPSVLWLGAADASVAEIERAARRKRIEVAFADCAREALAVARTLPVRAVVIATGDEGAAARLELVPQLRALARREKLPIVVLAGESDLSSRVAAARAGAQLYLVRPMSADSVVAAVAELLSANAAEQPRVLVVHDGPFGSEVAALLEANEMRTVLLPQPDKLFDVLDAERPDALLVAGRVGLYAGSEICRSVRANLRWEHLPVLLASSAVDGQEAVAAFEAGVDDFFHESIQQRELLARLRVRLEQARLSQVRSNQDLLTGLLTRRAFLQAASARLAEAQRNRDFLSLCMVDLDGFKQVNDSCGHAIGDQVLAAVGHLLRSRFRTEDLRGRWGGDEFVIAFRGMWPERAREVLYRVFGELVRGSFMRDTVLPCRVGVSAGVATFPVDGNSIDQLLLVADRRMYAAKLAGPNRVRI
jgi:diguanylate cyclase (GGDEF)-like protein